MEHSPNQEIPPAPDAALEAQDEDLAAVVAEAMSLDLSEPAGVVTTSAGLDLEIEEGLAFEEAVRKALVSVGGELLFQVHLDSATEGAAEGEHVAAISIGEGEARKLALVIRPEKGGRTRIEAAETSDNPLAPIARSYVGLVEAFKAAA